MHRRTDMAEPIAEQVREAVAYGRKAVADADPQETGEVVMPRFFLRVLLSAAESAAADRERAEEAERIIGPDADPCEGCADEWEDDSHPGGMTCRTNCERWTAYHSGLRGQLAVAKLDAATAWTTARCCAEAEKQQRARADANERDAGRFRVLDLADELYWRRHEEACASFHGEGPAGRRDRVAFSDDPDAKPRTALPTISVLADGIADALGAAAPEAGQTGE